MIADYYILDARSCVGNCALWWRPNGGGYTCELDDAGLYTLDDASSNSEHHIPIHRSIAERLAVRHVRWEPLHRAGVGISDAQRGVRPKILEPDQRERVGV